MRFVVCEYSAGNDQTNFGPPEQLTEWNPHRDFFFAIIVDHILEHIKWEFIYAGVGRSVSYYKFPNEHLLKFQVADDSIR